jgi:hypothetical protein
VDLKGGVLCQKAQSDGSWNVVLGSSRERREETSSSIATILREWNSGPLEKGKK